MTGEGRFDRDEDSKLMTCVTCPSLCRFACPVAEAECRETSSPQRLVSMASLLKDEKASPETAGQSIYHCTHCGACRDACLHKNDVPFLVSLARGRIMSAQSAPRAVRELCGHFAVAGNPQGESLDSTLESAAESAGVEIKRRAAVVYFPGCASLEGGPEVATAMLRATELYGHSELALTSASGACCGLPLLWAGEIEGFRQHARRFSERLEGTQRIVVHDAACAHAMRVRYRDVGVRFRPEVVHVAEFLSDIAGGEVELDRRDEAELVAYMDDCGLARGLGKVDAPRALLKQRSGEEPLEVGVFSGDQVDCCGASGLLPVTAPATARAMGEARIAAFRETGAAKLVMFSPRCVAHLKSIDPDLEVEDAVQVLARL